jgi:hypothetical protein
MVRIFRSIIKPEKENQIWNMLCRRMVGLSCVCCVLVVSVLFFFDSHFSTRLLLLLFFIIMKLGTMPVFVIEKIIVDGHTFRVQIFVCLFVW